MRLAYDIETNGLLDNLTHIKCLNMIELDTEVEYRFTDHEFYQDAWTGKVTDVPTPRDGTIADGLKMLAEADEIVAHNQSGFDEPAIRKVEPDWDTNARLRDSKLEAQMIWSDAKDRDFSRLRKGKLPQEFKGKRFVGSHKLAAWGYRLGVYKGDFNPTKYGHTWNEYPFSSQCDEYCMDDVRVLVKLVKLIDSKGWPAGPADLEYQVRQIIDRQEQHGFLFDIKGAERLVADLQSRLADLESRCQEVFPPWLARDGKPKVTKKDRRRFIEHPDGSTVRKYKGAEQWGYWSYWTGGEEHQPIKEKVFNPGSRDHIADRLIKLRGWVPTEFTPEGKPSVSEDILDTLEYPEAKLLSEYLMVAKRLGQISDGKQGWLRQVKDDGRIHGRVDTLGAVTSRMTHSHPNVAQVPRCGTPYGEECRSLFVVPESKKLVGCDAEGLELRMLAHYMARYDGGAYAKTVVEGRKEDGTDAHSVNQQALNLRLRDSAKTWLYAMVYGAGNYKLGTIVLADMTEERRAKFFARFPVGKKRNRAIVRLGVKSRQRLAANLPALAKLTESVKTASKRGFLRAIDGRLLRVRSEHAALNTLLQGGGAIVMKRALVITDDTLTSNVSTCGAYEFTANVHDEWQIESDKEIADEIGRVSADAIRRAGEHYELRVPLAGDFAIGQCWRDTH